MNKILSWTIGSFFRTIGRIIAYVAIGLLVAFVLSNSKLPKISNTLTDIFFMRVNAATYTQEIRQNGTYYMSLDSYDGFGANGDYLNKTVVASNSIISSNFVLDSTAVNNIKTHEYVQFNFMITHSGQGIEYNGNQIVSHTCRYWSCPTSNTLTLCTCTDYDNYTSQVWEDDIVGADNFSNQNISANIDYNGWYAPCNVQNNNIICPTNGQSYYKIILNIAYNDIQSNSPRIYIPRTLAVLDSVNTAQQIIDNQNSNTNSIINNQQANTNATIEALTDTNTTSTEGEASSFFSNFNTSDNGGLSSIITAPLSAIQSLTNASCSPLVLPLPYINENLTLPCMRTIYETHFGAFMVLYDTITIGIISYWILVRIFNMVKDFKNPDHDEIEVVDL